MEEPLQYSWNYLQELELIVLNGLLGNNQGDLYDLNVTLSNISDNNSVVLSNNVTGFIPTYTAYSECDKSTVH